MPSGKRARQQRQAAASAPPPVRSTGGTGARQASPKVLAGVGGVILIVIIAIVLAVVLSRNGSSGAYTGSGDAATIKIAAGTPTVGRSTSPDAAQGATDVAKLLKGIPQNGFVLGDPNAPVTLVEYIDLQCPDCLQFEQTQLEPLITKYVRKGQLKIKMQPWSILDRTADIHDSDRGQKATIAAAAQNKAFNFAQVLYWNQAVENTGWLTDKTISNIAASVDGLKPYKLAKDANGSETQSVIKDISSWANAHVNPSTGEMYGTPNIYLFKTGTAPKFYIAGKPDLGQLESQIDALLNK
jgi:protein-disulfide isomerase